MTPEIRWIGLASMTPNERSKRAVVELRDVTAQRTIDRMFCTHRHRTSAGAVRCATPWAKDLNSRRVGMDD